MNNFRPIQTSDIENFTKSHTNGFLEICDLIEDKEFLTQISINLDQDSNEVWVNLTRQETITIISILNSFL